MSVIDAVPLLAADGGDYQISRSVRLRSSASAYFSRTQGASGNLTKWTYSCWVKRGLIGSASQYPTIFSATLNASFNDSVYFNVSTDKLIWNVSNTLVALETTQVFRDPSAWYHLVFVWDTNNATAAYRARIYVNGVEITSFSTDNRGSISARSSTFNQNLVNYVGGSSNAALDFDGYFAEINFIDGQALTPSSFGETDVVTGVWKPKKYAGTYGTNGFYLNFSDNSAATAAAIGKDSSGNGNNWTPNNISVTSGVTYDSMLDVPTPYADGGNGRGNYPVINPLDYVTTNGSISNGNLTYTTNTSGSNNYQRASMKFPTSGKWYAEFTATQVNIGSGLGYGLIGVEGSNSFLWWVYSSPFYQIQGTNSTYTTIPTISSGDVVMVAVDMDAGKAWYGQNGTWLLSGNPSNGTAMSNPATFTAGSSNIGIALDGRTGSNTNIINANFGQRPFAYTPPTGFKALNTQNLPEPTIKKGNQYFDVSTWTGDGTNGRQVATTAFQPDMVWFKSRNGTFDHRVQDSARSGYRLSTNLTAAEGSDFGTFALLSNGYSASASLNDNNSAITYVGWSWKKGATQGFDIVTYSGDGTTGRAIAHNLGVAPKMMIVKSRTSGVASWSAWQVYHASLATPTTSFLRLNETSAAYTGYTAAWGNTTPTSSNFYVTYSAGAGVNGSGDTFVAYLFAEVAGFSKFGSYTGNGSADGPFVYCGFRPRFVMWKRTDTAGNNWVIQDGLRSATYNPQDGEIMPSSSAAESTSFSKVDLLSNGFKLRSTNAGENASGSTYIFAAFAENPFKNSLAR